MFQMTAVTLKTAMAMANVLTFMLLGFPPSNVSVMLGGLEKTALDVRRMFAHL